MVNPVLLFTTAIISSALSLPSTNDYLPRIEPQGDVKPFLSRANGNSARSRSCVNGTEFVVTLTDKAAEDQVTSSMNKRTGFTELNHCRSLRHSELDVNGTDFGDQLNAVSICIPNGEDVSNHLQVLLAMEGVISVEENVQVDHMGVPWHLDRIDQVFLPLDGIYNPNQPSPQWWILPFGTVFFIE